MILKKNTFAFRLNLHVVSSISLIALIIFSSFYFISRNLLLDSAEENAKNITEKNVNKIDAVISKASKIPTNIALVLETLNPTEEEIISLLEEIVKKNDEIYGSAIAFQPYSFKGNKYFYAPYVYKKDNKIIVDNLDDPSYEYFFQDWYQIPVHLDSSIWSEPYFDEGGGNILMTTYSVPFYRMIGDKKELWGIITIDIALDWLDQLVSSIKIYENGFAFVVSYAGTFVTHPNQNFIMNESVFSLAESHNLTSLREVGRKMIKGKVGFEKIESVTLKGDSRIYYTPFTSNQWSLAVMFPENELYASLNNLSIMIIVLGLIGLAFLITTVTIVSKKLTRPLSLFASAAYEIGLGKFDFELPTVKSDDEIGGLYNSFKKMQKELNNYIENLKETTAAKEKMESELRIAHKIQMDMVPKLFPPFPNRDDIDLHAFIYPAKEVGGDLYDFFFLDDDKIAVLVGDVAGKGVPAALFMAVTRTLIRSKMIKGLSTSEVVGEINRDLMQDNDSKLFVTLLLCIIDIKANTIEYTNAGHNPPYIISKDGNVNQLTDRHGMALGIFDLKPYTQSEYKMKSGDKFVLYTDGINEAMDKESNLYDYERFEKVLNEIANLSAKESTAHILKDIKEFTKDAEQSDDITLMVVSNK